MASLIVGYEVYCGEGHLLVSSSLFQSETYWARKCEKEGTEFVLMGKVPFETDTHIDRKIAVLLAKRAALKFDTTRVYDANWDGDVWFDLSILQEEETKEGFFQAIYDVILMNM